MSPNRLEALTKKRDEINQQIQALKARDKAKQRKEDTRRKILIGGVIMKMLNNGDLSQERLNNMLEKHLTRDKDRELFGLCVEQDKNTPEVKV